MKRLLKFHHLLASARTKRGATKEISLFLNKKALKALRNGYSIDETASILQIPITSIKKIQFIHSLNKHLSRFKIALKHSKQSSKEV